MEIPKGFVDIVKLVMKEPSEKVKNNSIWDRFVQVALIGGGRSEADINVLISWLNKENLLKLEKVNKLSGDKWSKEVEIILNKKAEKMDDDDKIFVNNFLKDLFRITACIKGLGRLFEKKDLINKIDEYTSDDEKTMEFIEEIAEDEDVAGVRQTKVVLWLHSIGRGKNAIPATRQVKSFVNNEIGPYYQYYDDDKYFVGKTMELTNELQKKIKGVTAYDVTRAMFFYYTTKAMVPRGLGKSFTCLRFLDFLKKNKLTLGKISEIFGDVKKRYKFAELVEKYARSIKKFE